MKEAIYSSLQVGKGSLPPLVFNETWRGKPPFLTCELACVASGFDCSICRKYGAAKGTFRYSVLELVHPYVINLHSLRPNRLVHALGTTPIPAHS
jgi:hypothetical protein